VLLHNVGEVDDKGYLDPKSKNILKVDALGEVRLRDSRSHLRAFCLLTNNVPPVLSLNKVVSTDKDNGKTRMEATLEPARVELEQAVAGYVAAHYATEAVSS
jgi:hypothetical protein